MYLFGTILLIFLLALQEITTLAHLLPALFITRLSSQHFSHILQSNSQFFDGMKFLRVTVSSSSVFKSIVVLKGIPIYIISPSLFSTKTDQYGILSAQQIAFKCFV